MSNKSISQIKSDLFLPLPLNWMDEQIQCIPSEDPMFTKSDRRCLFTLVEASATTRLCNMPHFGRNKIQRLRGFKLLLRKIVFFMTSF